MLKIDDMTKFNKTQFAENLTSEGFEVRTDRGLVEASIETVRGTLEVFATDTMVHVYKPNGQRKSYYEPTNSQAMARVRQTVKANATAWN